MTRSRGTPAALACAAALLLGCAAPAGSGVPADQSPMPTSPSTSPTASARVQAGDLLAARTAGDPRRFAALVSQAAATCTDEPSARRLGQLSAVAERWADAIVFARPKAQARTEAQLAEVDWAAVLSACESG